MRVGLGNWRWGEWGQGLGNFRWWSDGGDTVRIVITPSVCCYLFYIGEHPVYYSHINNVITAICNITLTFFYQIK